MKKITVFVLLVNVFLVLISCFSTGDLQRNSGQPNVNGRFLNPEEVVGKYMIGSDETGSYKFLLKQDGSLEYTLNENVYYGTWIFNEKQIMYRYTIEWTENEKKTGYIIDFMVGADFLEGSEIQLYGNWLYGYYPINKKIKFEK